MNAAARGSKRPWGRAGRRPRTRGGGRGGGKKGCALFLLALAGGVAEIVHLIVKTL